MLFNLNMSSGHDYANGEYSVSNNHKYPRLFLCNFAPKNNRVFLTVFFLKKNYLGTKHFENNGIW